jgi:hypothetical protein
METSEAEPRELTKLKDVWVLQNNNRRWDTEFKDLLILTKDEAEGLQAWKHAEGETRFEAISLRQWIGEWVDEDSERCWREVKILRIRVMKLDILNDKLATFGAWLVILLGISVGAHVLRWVL